MNNIKLFTIGFTKKSAEEFFSLLQESEVKRIVDIRLNNTSQLAGFAKCTDLEYFLKVICKIEFTHIPKLAPTQEILTSYKKNGGSWETFEQEFKKLIKARAIEDLINTHIINNSCLLCSESKPDFCHRRLVAEYFKQKAEYIQICHL